MMQTSPHSHDVIIIGAGPAGLIAAEHLARLGHRVGVYERKPSIGRKFLMAGRGGLNLTHSEEYDSFMKRYASAQEHLRAAIDAFTPAQLRDWCEGLGQETFVGSSGRVFPRAMKASPLLRNWRARLDELGVAFYLQHEWVGVDEKGIQLFCDADGNMIAAKARATLLALGGGSWAKLGSDGAWVPVLKQRGIDIAPLVAANCGFAVQWSENFISRFAGAPLKSVALSFNGHRVMGEAAITQGGIEGGAVYALSAQLRDAIMAHGSATLHIDLKPDLSLEKLEQRLGAPRQGLSFSNYMRRTLGLPPVALALLHETVADAKNLAPAALAAAIKAVSVTLAGVMPLDRAISTAGGVRFAEINAHYMLRKWPGVFVAGEMLDWEAPTGGYLLQATFATGIAAARGMDEWLKRQDA